MESTLIVIASSPLRFLSSPSPSPSPSPKTLNFRPRPRRLLAISSDSVRFTSRSSDPKNEASVDGQEQEPNLSVQVGDPSFAVPASRLALSDQAFFLLAFIACTASVAFTSLVVAAVPTLRAMAKAATSLSKLADTAREELPSTMAAIRLSGMEISDLTLELSDLSQEIADGVNKSAEAVQAAEAGIRRIGALANRETVSMIQERASVSISTLQPVVAGAAKKTTHAVGKATKTLMNMISGGEVNTKGIDRVDM